MGNKTKDLYAGLHARVETVETHLKGAMDELKSGAKDTQASLHAKLDAAKDKVAETKVDAEAAKAKDRKSNRSWPIIPP